MTLTITELENSQILNEIKTSGLARETLQGEIKTSVLVQQALLEVVKTSVLNQETLLEDIKALAQNRNTINQNVLNTLEHIHTEHWHYTGRGVPAASTLANEYHGNQDLDGNGMIYGIDFHIDPECPDRPPMLRSVPNNGVAMAWSTYLESI